MGWRTTPEWRELELSAAKEENYDRQNNQEVEYAESFHDTPFVRLSPFVLHLSREPSSIPISNRRPILLGKSLTLPH